MTGAEIKEWRSRSGLTQQRLAEMLDVATNTVARWEREEVSPPPFLNLALRNPKRESLAQYVRRVMRENNLTSFDVAKTSERRQQKISAPLVNAIINGEPVDPKVSSLMALANGLGRPVEELFQALGIYGETERDPEIEAIQVNYSQLSAPKRREARVLINVVSREIQRLLREPD